MSLSNHERKAPEHELTKGDVGVLLEDILLDNRGDVVDLTGVSEVRYQARFYGGATLEIDGVGSVVGTPTEGRVRYVFVSGDTDTAGPLLERWKVTFGGGGIEFFPTEPHKLLIRRST